jgi:allophanate hydrolase subunit 1
VDSPGGWRIIGRTDVPVFRPERDPAALIGVGDRLRFVPR